MRPARILDLFPLEGAFRPGETACFACEVQAQMDGDFGVRLSIHHLEEQIAVLHVPATLEPGNHRLPLAWQPPPDAPRGYGLSAELLDGAGRVIDRRSTAFDVLSAWTQFPRYGFLADFPSGRRGVAETLEALTRYHINGLQFYDWQYRHDALLPPTQEYLDPLSRALSLDTVKSLISAAHERGMAAMPYLAVYAASIEFWQAHPDWALYGGDGQPLTFAGFLGLMDPSAGSPWARHLLDECARVLSGLPFDGLHVDQYGEPKQAFDVRGHPVDLPAAFRDFIRALKAANPSRAVVFNAVGNWPVEALAASPVDFLYIEIWPPATSFRQLHEIVAGARAMSGGKPVVIALYLPAEQEVNVRLADALLFASGATRIELGEGERLLADPYFPKHRAISPSLKTVLRRYYDFAVRYEELFGPRAEDLPQVETDIEAGVWAIPRRSESWLVASLLNFSGLGEPRWDESLPPPDPLENVEIRLANPGPVRGVWWSSPDRGEPALSPAGWRVESGCLKVSLPYLDYWTLVAVEEEA